jgi:S1-C subfamily serine protease
MRHSWISTLNPVTGTAAAAVLSLLLAANAPAQSRSESSRNDSDSSSASDRDNNQSSSRSDNDRSNQTGQSSQTNQTSRRSQAANQASHPLLGVTFYNDQNAPLEVRRVMPGTPAEEAGLERGDEILSVDGRRVSSVQQLRQQIDRIGPNEEVELGILRDGRRTTVNARLTAGQRSSAGNRGGNQQQWNEPQYGANQGYGQQQQYGYNQGSNLAGNRSRNQQQWSGQQYGANQGYGRQQRGDPQFAGNEQGQGQGGAHTDYDRGFWDGYAQAQHEMGIGNQRSGNQNYGSQTYMRGSRNAGNWQGEQSQFSGGASANHAFLGVMLDENEDNGLRVTNVYPNSPAQEAGIRPGDEILSIDDDDVRSTDDLHRIMSQKDPDDEVAIEVDRNGRQRTLHATLTSQQEFMSQNRGGSYRMGRRTGSSQQGGYNDNRSSSRRQQNQNQDEDNDNY